jgi:DNA-binding Xre family transcriptional regulator
MSISYNRLWKLLIDKKTNKARLCKATGISSSTMDKLVKDENVELKTLASICKI